MSSGTTSFNTAASTALVANRFVASTNMANGAYTVANASPAWSGGCRIVATITGVTGNDTAGTLTVAGTDLAGNTITEVITLTAGGTATGTKVFRSVTSITQAGWVISGGNDTIVVGCEAGNIVCGSNGTLYSVLINVTAAATVVISDSVRTINTFPVSAAVGNYVFGPGIDFVGYLRIATTSTNDVTAVVSTTNPTPA